MQTSTNIQPINWNAVEDEQDLIIWNRLTSNFWLPEKIPVSNDLQSWAKLTEEEQDITRKVFAGLTLLDTMQSAGAAEIMKHSITQHEEAVMSNISFMESVHAKSYSNIFSTLCGTEEINQVFRWAWEDEHLQKKAQIIQSYYDAGDPVKSRVASVMLESLLFYSGFYWPFYLSSQGKLTNSADIIRLIVRDEAIHGYYIGYKYQQLEQKESQDFVHDLLFDLMECETAYTRNLYDSIGQTEDVMNFVRYNANKALMNLGYSPIYSAEQTQVSAAIMSSLAPDANENHDFFSGSGSSYVIGKAEETTDDDWEF